MKDKWFDVFVSECEYWIKEFSLNDWDVGYALDDTKESEACIVSNLSYMNATIYLNKNIQEENKNEHSIKRAAFHEVCELLLSYITTDLYAIFSENECSRKIHSIINRLEKLFFLKTRKAVRS